MSDDDVDAFDEPRSDFDGPRPRCTHCHRRVARNSRAAIVHDDGTRDEYCTHRRACRRAEHEALADNPDHVALPIDPYTVPSEAVGAALIAFDYVALPWWLRILPDRWLDGVRSSVATQVGGAVEASVRRRWSIS